MSIKRKALNRAGSLAAAVAVLLGASVPAVVPHVFAATEQVQTRSIQLSDATPGKTGVTYKVTFTTAQAGADSMVIDFCNDGSIIGATCTAPTGFTAAGATFTSVTAMSGWDVDTAPSFDDANTVAIHDTSGTSANAQAASTTVSFELVGITNPTQDGSTPTPKAAGTLWARVYTYASDDYGDAGGPGTPYTTPAALGDYLDYGGFAMSTTELINITATVMETLTFCTSKTQPGANCTTTTTPTLTIGHGSPRVIDSTFADTDDAYFQISTNALTGATVNMKTHNTCAGLSRDGGTDGCPIVANGVLGPIGSGLARFGMNVSSMGNGTGTLTPHANYSNGTATDYAMGAAVTSTYGDPIATTPGATASIDGHLTFAAQASVTTPAGVYKADESLIATGTF